MWFWIVFSTLVLAALPAAATWLARRRYMAEASAHKARAIPFAPIGVSGHLAAILGGRNGCAYSALSNLRQQTGDVFHVYLPGQIMLCVADLDLIEAILVDERASFPKAGQAIEEMKSVFGQEGILVSEGDVWLRQRRMCTPAFRVDQLKAMVGHMNRVTLKMLESLHGQQQFDALEIFCQAAFQNICIAGFNRDVGADPHDDTMLQAQTLASVELVKRIQRTPLWKHLPTPGNLRLRGLLESQEREMADIITRQRTMLDDSRLIINEFIRARDAEGLPLSEGELVSMCVQLMAAGHETTGTAMQWTLYYLATHPQVMERLREEADQWLGPGQLLDYEVVKKLKYFEQVFNEALRLRPPFPLFLRSTDRPLVLKNWYIPAGTTIFLMMAEVQTDPRYWGDDADKFDPEHFSDQQTAARPLHAFAPFGIGPRLCVGNKFTLLEAALILVPLIRAYDVALLPGQNVEPFFRTAWSTRHGLKFALTPRASAG